MPETSAIDSGVRTAFAELAGAVFDYHVRFPRQRPARPFEPFEDPSLVALRDSGVSPNLNLGRAIELWKPITESLWKAYPFSYFAPGGEGEPGIRSAAGGARLPPGGIFLALMGPAFARLHANQVSLERKIFVQEALRNLDDLEGVLNGGPADALIVSGVVGLKIPEGTSVATPWGVLRRLPDVDPMSMFMLQHQEPATCSLTEIRPISMKVDRDRDWNDRFEASEISVERVRTLLPVAAALASGNADDARGPALTWKIVIPAISFGLGSSRPLIRARMWGPLLDIDPGHLAEWCRLVGAEHRPTIDVAARRLANALSYRWEKADVLIDAVTVWENLVGTSSEVSFRVTGAIAKVLESEPSRRLALRARLNEIYSLRSRIVHGAAVKPSDVNAAAKEAVSVCVRVMRIFYQRGAQWLEKASHDRANEILLLEA